MQFCKDVAPEVKNIILSINAYSLNEFINRSVDFRTFAPGMNVKVEDIELRMEPPQYTIRTLDALKARESENDFSLIIGADNLESFPRWRDYGRILKEYGVAVFPRKGYHRGHLRARLLKEDPSYRIELLKAPLVNISSTEIREGIAEGRDMTKWLM